jgi:hypothetical protein
MPVDSRTTYKRQVASNTFTLQGLRKFKKMDRFGLVLLALSALSVAAPVTETDIPAVPTQPPLEPNEVQLRP